MIDINRWNQLGKKYWLTRTDKQKWAHNYVLFNSICEMINKQNLIYLLDYGCGGGELLNYISMCLKNVKATGYDISPNMRNVAKRQFPMLDIIDTFIFDQYDIICMNLVLQDVDKPVELLSQLKNNLKKNGHIIITLPHPVFSLIEADHLTTQRVIQNSNGSKGIYRYLFEETERVHWNTDNSNWTNLYNRTFSTYSLIFSEAGYLIDYITEPLPIESGKCDNELYNLFSLTPKFVLFCITPKVK